MTPVALSTTAGSQAAQRWEMTGRSASVVTWPNIARTLGRDELGGAEIEEVIVVDAADTIELVVSPSPNWSGVADGIAALQAAGWLVTVLTHLGRMGEAHVALSGSAATLQGWWQNDAGWRFSTSEIA